MDILKSVLAELTRENASRYEHHTCFTDACDTMRPFKETVILLVI